jgi:hypothetical protein
MAETLSLSSPEVIPAITTSVYKVIEIGLRWEAQMITIALRGEHGEYKSFIYGGPLQNDADRTKATNLMIALNKANLSTVSLQHRVLNQLIADGLISGTVTGTPD